MINDDVFSRLLMAIPFLQMASPQFIQAVQQNTFLARMSVGQDVLIEGQDVDDIAILLSGVVRVYKIGQTGREITLYRFGVGESCILTANALIAHQAFSAIATVEKDAEAVMIPADVFRDWLHRYDLWRGFIFGLLSQRLADMMAVIDEVAFQRMDLRVARLLFERSQKQSIIVMTHQEMAAELAVLVR